MLGNVLLCGFFGGLATVMGKFCFSDNIMISKVFTTCFAWGFSTTMCDRSVILFRLLGFLSVVACNAFIVGYFLKAMEKNNTTVVVVVSSAANFLTSGILGQVLFAETVSITWYAGSGLIMIGMILVVMSEGAFQSPRKE